MSRMKKGEENPTIECACGCGEKFKKYDKWKNSRKFIKGHKIGMMDVECIKKRFWSKVNKRKEDECWEWQASRHPRGYGAFSAKIITTKKAHRIAWILTYGFIPKGLYVCHHCDNPPCCNPKHLFLGTQKDNIVDSALKGRQSQKLSEKDIIEIRRKYTIEGVPQPQIANQFGIDRRTVSEIVAGEKWAWVKYLPSGGQKQPRMKLSNNDVLIIRKRYNAEDITQKKLSEIYCVDQSTISKIISMHQRKGIATI